MNSVIRLLLFYLINLAAFILLGLLFGGSLLYMIENVGARLLMAPLFAIIRGLIIGFILMVVVNDSTKNKKVFTTAQVISGCILFSVLLYNHVSKWNHKRNYGNIEANQDYFKYFIKNNRNEKKISFDTLLTKFSDPNYIELTGSMSEKKDTVINGDTNQLLYIRLMYKKKNLEETLKADFTVSNSIAQMHYYDIPLSESDKKRIFVQEQQINKTLKDATRIVEEMTKKRKEEQKKLRK